jgi:hypothetical protein
MGATSTGALVPGWYRWRAAGRTASGGSGDWGAWSSAIQITSELVAGSASGVAWTAVANKPAVGRGLLSARPADGGVTNSEWTETNEADVAVRVWKWTGSAWVLQADVALPDVQIAATVNVAAGEAVLDTTASGLTMSLSANGGPLLPRTGHVIRTVGGNRALEVTYAPDATDAHLVRAVQIPVRGNVGRVWRASIRAEKTAGSPTQHIIAYAWNADFTSNAGVSGVTGSGSVALTAQPQTVYADIPITQAMLDAGREWVTVSFYRDGLAGAAVISSEHCLYDITAELYADGTPVRDRQPVDPGSTRNRDRGASPTAPASPCCVISGWTPARNRQS